MLDFLMIATRNTKNGVEIYPKFIIKKSNDLMIRGGDFYAIWIEERGLWSTDEEDVIRLVDNELSQYADQYRKQFGISPKVLYMWDSESGMIDRWHKYCQSQMRDNYSTLDESLIFSNADTKKKDYATKRLTYPLEPGPIPAFNKLISTLYSEEERHKIEWAIGSIVTGESKKIQKFMVLYGGPGTGKSTILNIIQQLFEGYYSVFDAKALGSSNNSFALEAFKSNPLVAIQHDGDLPIKRKFSFKSGVNIMFGCNNFCSYCIVPYVRGRERSRQPQDIIREIENLVADGVCEVMLLGQNVNSYGKNLENPMTFAELLREINKIEGLKRIRFMTSHPKDLSDELIYAMRDCEKVCKHMHLPLQSGSSNILKVMNRHYNKEQYLALVDKLRNEIPDIALTTDIIVGFPGETDEDFLETLDVVQRVEYDSAFTFIYSKRTGTPAAAMENQVPEAEVKCHFDRLLREVQEISTKKAMALEGKVMPVLVEEMNEQDASLVTGRLDNSSVVHFPGTTRRM